MAPLILTVRLDEVSFRFFNTLRRRYFPPERNWLQAHLTLFHHLPDTEWVRSTVAQAADGINGPLLLEVTGLMKLGGGVAYRLQSDVLLQLHRNLQQGFKPELKLQDLQGLRPHITVQNKVPAATAGALYHRLQMGFRPFTAAGLGLELWHYAGGPWTPAGYRNFNGCNA